MLFLSFKRPRERQWESGLLPFSQLFPKKQQLSTPLWTQSIEQWKPSGFVRGLFSAVCECVCEFTQKKRSRHRLDWLGNFSMLEEQKRERKKRVRRREESVIRLPSWLVTANWGSNNHHKAALWLWGQNVLISPLQSWNEVLTTSSPPVVFKF